MHRVLKAIAEVMKETYAGFIYGMRKHGLTCTATLLEIVSPYIMYMLGQSLAMDRGYVGVGGELFLPLVVWCVIKFLRSVANQLNVGQKIPKPSQRFTEVDEDGMVSVEQNRLEEMLVYMADLEDWMERKGWL